MKKEIVKQKDKVINLASNHFTLTSSSLAVQGNPSYQEWVAFGKAIQKVEGAVHWWVGDWQNYGEAAYGDKNEEAIEATGFSYSTIEHDKWIAKEFEFCRRRQNLSWSHHAEVAGLEPQQQDRLLDKAEAEGLSKRQLREEKKKLELLPTPDLPSDKYGVIVVDPPWPMEKIRRECRPNQVEFDYPTMPEPELEALKLPAADDCHLFLWTTQKFLPMSLRLLLCWEFRYVCLFVWHKNGGYQVVGLPQYNCELIVYARKGTPTFVSTKAFNTCFSAKRGKHSEKPEEFYEMIRNVTKPGRIDMYSRRKIKGFDSWGNESV